MGLAIFLLSWLVVSPALALLIGGAINLRDRHETPRPVAVEVRA